MPRVGPGCLAMLQAAVMLSQTSTAMADGDECRLLRWRYVNGNRVIILVDDGYERTVVPPTPNLILRFDWSRQLFRMPDYKGHKAWISSRFLADCPMISPTCVTTDVDGHKNLSTRGLEPPRSCLNARDAVPEH